MKTAFSMGWVAAVLACQVTTAVFAAAAGNVSEGLTSTKERGVVSVVSDPTLSDGRLVLKVVAMNRAQEAASFGPDNVKISTASGMPVKLMSLDKLVEETRAAADQSAGGMAHGPTSHPGAGFGHDSYGRPDVGGYTGGNDNMNGIAATQNRMTVGKGSQDDPRLQEQIASLNAAILHNLTIAPTAAAGGQLVTEKIKFGRKEARDLHLVVDFNGELHEFDFTAPPAR